MSLDIEKLSDAFEAAKAEAGADDHIEGVRDEIKAAMWIESLQRPFFDDLSNEIHVTNVEKGFWGEPEMMDKYIAKLALIHSELTEVLEALRKSQGPDKVTEEFADVLIRTFDLYGVLVEAGEADPELFGVMKDKMFVNATRPPKHGNRWG